MDDFLRLAQLVGLVALDVGARGGVNEDLEPLARSVDYYGFEPDPEECARLNKDIRQHPWKSLTFIPTALAAAEGILDLNLYRHRGCSSVLRAQQELGALFSRGDYYIHEATLPVPARPLDAVVGEHRIEQPAFMKIDVQGMEVDCFGGAEQTLSNDLVGIRTEVSFFPIYEGQGLFAEVDQALRPYGFVPMRWLEIHEWRRTTRVKFPTSSDGIIRCSRGQMIHADVLYLLQPEMIEGDTDVDARRLVRLGLIATCYGHLDHAYAAFTRPCALEFIKAHSNMDPVLGLSKISRRMAKSAWWSSKWSQLNRVTQKIKNLSR